MSGHFTAVLTITETAKPATAATTFDRRIQAPPTEPSREVVEVAKVVVRADTLDALRDKIAAHSALIAD